MSIKKPRFIHFLRNFPSFRAMQRYFDKFGIESLSGQRALLYDIYCDYWKKARECFDSGLDFQPYEVEFSRSIDALGIFHFFDGV